MARSFTVVQKLGAHFLVSVVRPVQPHRISGRQPAQPPFPRTQSYVLSSAAGSLLLSSRALREYENTGMRRLDWVR